ncbi:MAG TPA: glycosyltransferase family 4 protein [Solirubrobacteraceae bacterium]|nr:glycosyltransferase family 4 protein [Solirubrobacteraceae bacterium]
MRLLYLSSDPGVPVFGGKGASVHVRAMVRAFSRVGHEVILASPRIEPGEERLPDGARCVEIPAVRPRSLTTAGEVTAAIASQAEAVLSLAREARVDAIYERYSLTGCAGARTARAIDVPLLVEVNAPLREEERRFRELAHESVALEAERETFEAASLIVAISPWLAEWLGSLGVDRDRIVVIPNPPPDQLLGAHRALRDDEALTVGFSGSLKPWHGVETLVQGFLEAVEAGARMRLEILGDGPAAAEIDVAAGGCPQIVRLGHLSHSQALTQLAGWDIGAAPYRSLDSFYFSPLKLSEYMAAGVCPLVSDLGGLPDAVERGKAGVIVPPDDPSALGAALLALDADRARVRRLGARAQWLSRQRPSWVQIAELLTEAINRATTRGALSEMAQ